ncbi:hypothetical protein ABZ345_23660 [Lentzea sp. NPDC005914]|uniref:hypothetical protein n=1 Tax=Lentzea sp. NPDC005914 TaxID=3154572 RepID=UPI0033C27D84
MAVLSTSYRVDELCNVTAVMRRRDGAEEWLGRDNVWRAEQRDLRGQVHLPIGEEELERLKWTVASPLWFVVHDDRDYPYAVVRKIPSAEEAFTRDLRWEPSDLLGREDLRVEEFPNQGAASDPRAAIEIGVRSDRQRVRGGPEHFTLWPGVHFDPQRLSSVIRRTEAGEEVCVGHSGWVRSSMLDDVPRDFYPFYRVLPISPVEAGEILSRRSEPRCYHVLTADEGQDVPFAIVQVDGEREEAFTRDLVWGPSDLLSGSRTSPACECGSSCRAGHRGRRRSGWPTRYGGGAAVPSGRASTGTSRSSRTGSPRRTSRTPAGSSAPRPGASSASGSTTTVSGPAPSHWTTSTGASPTTCTCRSALKRPSAW